MTPPAARRRRLIALCAFGAATYAALEALSSGAGVGLPDAVIVGVPFLAVPAAALWRWGEPAGWGRLDASFLWSAAAYAPFALWVAASVPTAPAKYFSYLPGAAFSFPGGLLWGVLTFVHVGAVDYFTKRVVQEESEALWGNRVAQGLQLAAWSGGHVVEWFWLREVLGDVGAAAFLVSAGLLTGLVYARLRCVSGLMVGHLLVNVAAAAAALGVYG